MSRRQPDFPLDRLGTLAVRLVLLAAPPAFRRQFRTDMLDALRRRAHDVRREAGTRAAGRYWVRQWLDVLRAVFAEWASLGWRRPGRLGTSESFPALERLVMDTLFSDLRLAFRNLVKRPGFTGIVVLTLGLGIGANTAIFSILDAVVLRPLPYERPEELLLIIDDLRTYDLNRAPLAEYEVQAVRERTELFAAIGASAGPFQSPLTSPDAEPEQIRMMSLTPGYLGMLGVRPLLGRDFTEEEAAAVDPAVFLDPDLEAPPSAALLDYDFWQRRFGGDPAAVGRDVTLNSRRFRIIGVLPEGFRIYTPPLLSGGPNGNQATDVYSPLQVDFAAATTGAGYLMVVGRLAEGVSREQGRAEIAAVAAELRENHERSRRAEIHMDAVPWATEVARDVRPALLALVGAVGFVLLIACANVANLLLARATSRQQEIAVRAALGAPRARIVRQVLTENLMLAGFGGALGLLLAAWGVRAILALQPGGMPRSETVSINLTVLAFTAMATLLAVLLFGVAPALALSAVRGKLALNERGTGGGTRSRARLRSGLVVAEVALSLVLLVGAGLLLRSFGHLSGTDPGFRAQGLTTFQVALPFFGYRDMDSRDRFMREALRRLEPLPGVESAAASTALPLSGLLFAGSFRIDGMSEEDPGVEANYRGISAGYFRTLGIPILEGRELDPLESDPTLAIVDRQLAEHVFPGESAIGRRLRLRLPTFPGGPAGDMEAEIVGVVGNVRDDAGLEAPGRRTVYLPHQAIAFGGLSFALRTSLDAREVLARVRDEVAAVDPDLPMFAVRPMQGYIDDALAPVRFSLILAGLFGVFATLLASVGLYGVLANSVRQQQRDLGVRLAFGATSTRILREVVGRGALLAGIGIVCGLAIALPVTRALQRLFVGVSPGDPLTLVVISALLLGVSVAACYLPARRAARLDPASSLRSD